MPPCWDSKCHVTLAGPFTSIVPINLITGGVPAHPVTETVLGSTLTETFVTDALGASTTGMEAKFPEALVTLTETQQFLPELNGSTIYHQLPSEFLPTICELWPTFNALMATQAVPGPKRQLTATSFGEATGTAGVEVKVGGGVEDGNGVFEGTSVVGGTVFVEGSIVTVGVPGALDGRLQASMLKTNRRLARKGWCFMDLLLSLREIVQRLSYAKVPLTTIDHSVCGGDIKPSTDSLHADLIQ